MQKTADIRTKIAGTLLALVSRQATGSFAKGSKCVLRSCAFFCLTSGHTIMVSKGPRSPKHAAIAIFSRSYLSPLSLLFGREPCGDSILRSRLQKAPATARSNYAQEPAEIVRTAMGPKMITNILLFGNSFPNCTGHLLHRVFLQEFFCVIWASIRS